MSRRLFLLATLASTLVLFVAVNALAGVVLRGASLDLTEDSLYSLSRGSDDVLAAIPEPIDLTFYFSRGLAQDYPQIRAYGARVRETLQMLVDRSAGKLRLTIVDPEPFSEEEDQAIAAGLRGAPTEGGAVVYFGLTARNALDETVVAPFFSPDREPYLEYELLRLIVDLGRDAETTVALITSLPLETPAADPFGGAEVPRPIYFYDQLLASFDVVTLDRDFDAIPPQADVLVIAHPWELDDVQLWAVDQFVLERGRALVLVDPYSRLSQAPGPTGFPDMDAVRTSTLGPLLAAWGVSYDPTVVLLDRAQALTAAVQEEGRVTERPYPVWFDGPADQLASGDLATAALNRGVRVAVAGAVSPLEGAATTFEPLAVTSDDARAIDIDQAVDAVPEDLLADYAPEGVFTLAARVSGEITSAFPDGAPEGVDAPLPLTEGRAEIVVMADADVLDDTFYVVRDPLYGDTTLADNAVLLLNAIDLLAGADALVGLRSRARADRPLTRIEDMRAGAEAALLAEQSRLEEELAASEQRMAELEEEIGAAGLVGDADASAEREANLELLRVRDAVLDARARLREIEREHRRDIERLQATVIALNVWLLPLLVALCGVGVFVARRRAAGLGS